MAKKTEKKNKSKKTAGMGRKRPKGKKSKGISAAGGK
jgi:hypothetical protein